MTDVLDHGTWHRAGDIAVVDHEDRVVALNLQEPAAPPVVLEGTAALIWHLLEQADTEVRLVGAAARAFHVHPAQVRGDVHAFLLQLKDLGFVTPGVSR